MRTSARLCRATLFALLVAAPENLALAQEVPVSRVAPAPSQVTPPALPSTPQGAPQIPGVTPPEAAGFPKDAEKLSFMLLGFDIEGEFPEFLATRTQLAAPLIGKRVTVADVFTFANKLQEAYVRAGYLLVRVVISPQELSDQARVKIQVIDGFIERIDVTALPGAVRGRVAVVVEPLRGKHHLLQSELVRRLLIASDTPGLELASTFAAGQEIGGSVLILTGPHRLVTASAYVDNAMPITFGTWQTVGLFGLNSVLGLGEQISVSGTGYPDQNVTSQFPTRRFVQGSFAMPLGIDGFKLFIAGTDGKTTPLVPPLAATQGIFRQTNWVLGYDAVKTRDFNLTLSARLDVTNERVDTLVLGPSIPLSYDKVRPIRGTIDGSWRIRDTDTNIVFGATVSRGLHALGARTLSDASFELPLSRQGADAVFTKLNVGLGIYQNLPSNFFLNTTSYAQNSFNRPMLTSEQFDIVGPKMLSGFTTGSLPGDSSWVVRSEFGNVVQVPHETGGINITQYIFAATGERIFYQPTILEIASVHATNYGLGLRFQSVRWNQFMPNNYFFIEGSRRESTNPLLDGWRVFGGMLVQY
jgi:hemolysin activation/secretion protein